MTPSPSLSAWPKTRVEVLVRIRGDRVFYRDPPARQGGTRGRPRRHGRRLKLSDNAHVGSSRCRAQHHRSPLRHGAGADVARCASEDHRPGPLGERRRAARSCAAACCASTSSICLEPDGRVKEDVVVVVGRRWRARPRTVLPGLPASLRPRAHVPLRQEHTRMDSAITVHPRAGRPLDVDRHCCAEPASPRPRPRR